MTLFQIDHWRLKVEPIKEEYSNIESQTRKKYKELHEDLANLTIENDALKADKKHYEEVNRQQAKIIERLETAIKQLEERLPVNA